MSDAALSAAVLLLSLLLFVSGRLRHDLVALLALFAAVLLGLVPPEGALAGFADPAVVAVAAVLVVGRAVELSGIAAAITRRLVPATAGFVVRLGAVLLLGAVLSAFMNNIAALVVTMPIATQIARDTRRPVSLVLMPLAFATILGGMTTLIGTPANIVLSSVRKAQLGADFGFFAMTPVGVAVTLAGLVYLTFIGWRLLPQHQAERPGEKALWRAFELLVPAASAGDPLLVRRRLRGAGARLMASFRGRSRLDADAPLAADDRLLVLGRASPWEVAEAAELLPAAPRGADGDVTARVVVAYGSALIGLSLGEVRLRAQGALNVVAAGPSALLGRQPLDQVRIAGGDELFVRGASSAIADFAADARLLEIDRLDVRSIAGGRAAKVLGLFLLGILAVVLAGAPPALAFLATATAMAALRLLPSRDLYRAVDWPVIVLLAAMIPVGHSFETSGAAEYVASWLSGVLGDASLFSALAALCAATLLLSMFLNNVACALIMGPLAVQVADRLGISPDAALLAVLIGTSSDFLTPIGHQNNLLVMAPGGYRFTDYARAGAALAVLVVLVSAAVLARQFAPG